MVRHRVGVGPNPGRTGRKPQIRVKALPWVVDEGVMNEVFPRCAVPGSSCRLLQLEAPGARPVWAVLDAAGARHFTGEITLHCVPTVRAWFNGGELYFAEREGDPGLADRLLAMGVLSTDDLSAGSVQLGAVTHLGRLFDRVPRLDRDHVELALEILTGEVVGEIADHVVEEITIASYRHHPSGVVKWHKRPTVVITQVGGDVDPSAAASAVTAPAAARPGPISFAEPSDLTPSAEDEALVAEYEASLAVAESEDPAHAVEAHDHQHLDQHDPDQHDDQHDGIRVEDVQAPDQEVAVVEEPSTAATREQPVFDDLFLAPEPAAEIDLARNDAQPIPQPIVQPDAAHPVPAEIEAEIEVEAEIEAEIEAEVDLSVPSFDTPIDTPIDTAFDPGTPVEAPVVDAVEAYIEAHAEPSGEPEDALAAFERSLNAQLDATFAQHFDQHLLPLAPADDAQPFLTQPVLEQPVLEQPVLEQPVLGLPTIDEQEQQEPHDLHDLHDLHDQHDQTDSAVDAPVLTEQTWAIDDRVDWHVDTPAPADPEPATMPTMPTMPTVPTLPAASATADGPVVEFDLQHLLQQHDTDRSLGSMTVGGVEVPEETDADIRAAVQAALAEIAAATRPGGDHEVPSILMQAALVADAETGLTPSPDLWDVAAPTAVTPPPTAARPVMPILPDRAPSAAPLPPIRPASETTAVADTDADEAAPDAAEDPDAERTERPEEVVAPPMGGLRRLMGSRKP